MIDAWAETYPAGQQQEFPVIVINDLADDWNGAVRFRLMRKNAVVEERSSPCLVRALGETNVTFALKIPPEPGAYQVEAALIHPGDAPVRSLRDFFCLLPGQIK